jgi:hypothetical protein
MKEKPSGVTFGRGELRKGLNTPPTTILHPKIILKVEENG